MEIKNKLQELYHDEVKYHQELNTNKQVYNGGLQYHQHQLTKTLMGKCALVLSECENSGNGR